MTWPRAALGTPPVTVDRQADDIANWIAGQYAQGRGGTVKVMESMWHLWEEILLSSDAPRVLVCCTGEKPRTDEYTHRVDRSWTVVVLRGHGFRNLEVGEEGAPPGSVETLNASVEAVRDCVRRLDTVSEEFPLNYRGWSPLPPVARPGTANVFVAGATLEFITANDIGQVNT